MMGAEIEQNTTLQNTFLASEHLPWAEIMADGDLQVSNFFWMGK